MQRPVVFLLLVMVSTSWIARATNNQQSRTDGILVDLLQQHGLALLDDTTSSAMGLSSTTPLLLSNNKPPVPPIPPIVPYQLQVTLVFHYNVTKWLTNSGMVDSSMNNNNNNNYIMWLRGGPQFRGITHAPPIALGVPLQHMTASSSSWTTTLHYNSSHVGSLLQLRVALAPSNPQGSLQIWNTHQWFDMIGPNFAISLPVSHEPTNGTDTWPTLTFVPSFVRQHPGRDNQSSSQLMMWNGAIIDSSTSTLPIHYHGNRSLLIYYPPSWNETNQRIYDVLIVTDHTMLPLIVSQMNLLATNTCQIDEHIVIAPVFLSNDERYNLSTPVPGWMKDDTDGSNHLVGGDAQSFINWLVDSMLQQVYLHLFERNRIDPTRRIGILGNDIGGLLACHALWTRPDRISSAACQSPSLWWPFNDKDEPQYHFLNVTLFTNITSSSSVPLSSSNIATIQWRPSTSIYVDAERTSSSPTTLNTYIEKGVSRLISLLATLGTHRMGETLFAHRIDPTSTINITTMHDATKPITVLHAAASDRIWLPLITLWPSRGSASLASLDFPHSDPSPSSHSELYAILSISIVALLVLIPLTCVNVRRPSGDHNRASTTLPAGFKRGAARERLASVSSIGVGTDIFGFGALTSAPPPAGTGNDNGGSRTPSRRGSGSGSVSKQHGGLAGDLSGANRSLNGSFSSHAISRESSFSHHQ
jgi:hypothetical protein